MYISTGFCCVLLLLFPCDRLCFAGRFLRKLERSEKEKTERDTAKSPLNACCILHTQFI